MIFVPFRPLPKPNWSSWADKPCATSGPKRKNGLSDPSAAVTSPMRSVESSTKFKLVTTAVRAQKKRMRCNYSSSKVCQPSMSSTADSCPKKRVQTQRLFWGIGCLATASLLYGGTRTHIPGTGLRTRTDVEKTQDRPLLRAE